ncbi:hypothetical protein HXP44_11925 [Streptomyces sioyaensis]|nr:hypothetical protein [Streptomyces sioyaensis]
MTWFPVHDHPKDKASYDFTLTVPQGSTAVANGTYGGQKTAHGRTPSAGSSESVATPRACLRHA